MLNHTYKIIELVGSSTTGTDDAITKASLTHKNIEWFELVETRGHIEDGVVVHFQASVNSKLSRIATTEVLCSHDENLSL